MTRSRDDAARNRKSSPGTLPAEGGESPPPAKPGEEDARRRVSLAGAIATVSLVVALFSAAFGVLRARDEDRSQLRADLASIMRRLTVLNADDATSNRDQTERVALVAEARQIFPQLVSIPSVYYRNVAEAMDNALYYGDALAFSDKGIRQAIREGDHIEEVYGHRLKAIIYASSLRDAPSMRGAYEAALKATRKLQHGADIQAGLETRLVTLMRWATAEVAFRGCGRALKLQNSAEDVLREDDALRSRWQSEVTSSSRNIDDDCPTQ